MKKDIFKQKITLILKDGSEKMMKIGDAFDFLSRDERYEDLTDMEVYKCITKEGVLDLKSLEAIKKSKYVDFSSEAPQVLHFYGRKNEIGKLNRWLEEKGGHNIIFIHGMAGIGKTTLAAKLIDSYRESKHLFWHDFHELDTLRGVLLKIADFLTELGNDHLELFLRTRTSLDAHEIIRILGKSIRKIDTIIVFDDFQKSMMRLGNSLFIS